MSGVPFAFWKGPGVPSEISGYWMMDEASGNASDSSGNGWLATETGTVPRAAGIIGNCAGNFTTNNYFTVNSAIGGTTTYMIEFWYNQTVDANYYFLNKYDGAANGWWVRQLNNHVVADGYGATTLTSSNNPLGAGWHYYVVARRALAGANESRLYLDGVLDAQGVGAANTVSPASAMFIGADINGVTNQHKLDEVAFWGDISALSWVTIESYITDRYNGGLGSSY